MCSFARLPQSQEQEKLNQEVLLASCSRNNPTRSVGLIGGGGLKGQPSRLLRGTAQDSGTPATISTGGGDWAQS